MKEIKIKNINNVIAGAFLCVMSVPAFAQVESVVKDAALVSTIGGNANVAVVPNNASANPTNKISVPGIVINIGKKSDHPIHKQLLKGFANGLPLVVVMKQITPNGWIVKSSNSATNILDTKKNVSWVKGFTWTETLEKIAREYHINASINWDEKTIVLSNSLREVAAVKPKRSIFELADAVEEATPDLLQDNKIISDITVGQSEITIKSAPKKVIPVVPVKPALTEWALIDTKTLKENVVAWGEKEGYRVVWTAEDYSVVNTVIKAGKFDSEDGPIKQLSVDYGPESRVQNPLSFQFYQNNTLVVENITYEQSGYSQYNKKSSN